MSIEIGRIKVVTTGWIGGPGLSQLYFTGATAGTVTNADAVNAAAAVRAFYFALVAWNANGWTATVQPVVQVIEATTGALIREEAITAPALVTGTGGASWGSTSSGVVASWHTSSVFGRHLLRGRTFLTPLYASSINTSGQITAAVVTGVQAAGATLVASAAANMVVWHRPHPLSSSANGGYGDMTACSVSAVEGILRSRRD
jgi:hypothetical protein